MEIRERWARMATVACWDKLGAIRLIGVLARWTTGSDGHVWACNDDIAREIGRSVKTVERDLRVLVERGLIQCETKAKMRGANLDGKLRKIYLATPS